MAKLNPPEVDKSARRTRQTNGGQAADKYGKSGNNQSDFACASSFANATEDRTPDKLSIIN